MHTLRSAAIWAVLYYLRFWAQVALFIHRPTIIGVAGSAGKSSTKEALYAALQDHFSTTFTYGNSETGVPLGILGIEAGSPSALNWIKNVLIAPFSIFHLKKFSHLIIEMGTDEPTPPKNMDYLLTIVQPDLAIWLNAYPIHTQQFSVVLDQLDPADLAHWDQVKKLDYVVQALAHEDGKIITQSNCRLGIYNRDNTYLNQEISTYLNHNPLANLLSFGSSADNALAYTSYTVTPEHSQFGFSLGGQPIQLTLAGYLLPQAYQEVFGSALLTASQLGLSPEQAVTGITNHFHLPKSRASMLAGINGATIIDSSYNAATAPTLEFLNLLSQLKAQTNRPIVFVWGDMRELGQAAATEHAKVAAHLSGTVDYLYCVGALTQQYVMPIAMPELKDKQWFQTSGQAGAYLKDHLPAQAIVLVKGSQNTIFLEETVKMLLANPADAAKLCRQEKYWLKLKK